jgi:hypothetical protein
MAAGQVSGGRHWTRPRMGSWAANWSGACIAWCNKTPRVPGYEGWFLHDPDRLCQLNFGLSHPMQHTMSQHLAQEA